MGLVASSSTPRDEGHGCPSALDAAGARIALDAIGARLANESCSLCSHGLGDERHNPDGRVHAYVLCACRHIFHQSCMHTWLVDQFRAVIRHPTHTSTRVDVPASQIVYCPACRGDFNHACNVKCAVTRTARPWWMWWNPAATYTSQAQ